MKKFWKCNNGNPDTICPANSPSTLDISPVPATVEECLKMCHLGGWCVRFVNFLVPGPPVSDFACLQTGTLNLSSASALDPVFAAAGPAAAQCHLFRVRPGTTWHTRLRSRFPTLFPPFARK
jgi:hypothetical protein